MHKTLYLHGGVYDRIEYYSFVAASNDFLLKNQGNLFSTKISSEGGLFYCACINMSKDYYSDDNKYMYYYTEHELPYMYNGQFVTCGIWWYRKTAVKQQCMHCPKFHETILSIVNRIIFNQNISNIH